MSLPLIFRRAAQAEFEEAAAWYEGRRSGLGDEFVGKVQTVLDVIRNQPDRYPLVTDDVREAPVSQFPYCIYYRVKPDRVVVLSVFHTARDPGIWQSRN